MRPKTLTVSEAAAQLGIARCTAYRLVARGELPAIRLGGRLLVPRAALERLLDGAWSSCPPAAAAPGAGDRK